MLTVAALSLFAMVVMPTQASNLPLTQTNQTSKSTPPPAGSFDTAGGIGMAADAIGRSRFADIYSGIALTNHGTHVNVYLTKLDPQTEKAIEGSAPADTFTFVLTPHTEKQMNDLHQAVIDQSATLEANGIDLVSWGPDVKTGKESIEVENLTPSQTNTLNALFGSENIELKNATSKPIFYDNRSNDSAPWNGGDFITHTGDCTSGFPATSGTTNYLITASHCFLLGDQIYNGSLNENLGNYPTMGSVTKQDTSSNGLDAELIDTSSYGGSNTMIWAGSSTSPTDDAVSGATSSPVGYQVCQSGAFEGEICGLVIQNSNMCINSGTRQVCNIVQAANTSGGIAAGQGDSGGPVFRFSGSSLLSTGILSAGSSTSIPCTNYPTNRQCSSTMYYTDINPILSKYGLTIK